MADSPAQQTPVDAKPFATWWHRFWRGCRKTWYHFRLWLFGVASHRIVAIVLPGVTGAYATMDAVWGLKWRWFYAHRGTHDLLQTCLVVATVLGYLGLAFGRSSSAAINERKVVEPLNKFITLVALIVRTKMNRFREKLLLCKNDGKSKTRLDVFDLITQPMEQVKAIVSHSTAFLRELYLLGDDEIDVTIVRQKAGTSAWDFYYRHQNSWTHGDPAKFMAAGGLASRAINLGEAIFAVDKFTSSDYRLSDRDLRRKQGSAYCFPSVIETPTGTERWVVSIMTYERQFCDEWDANSVATTESFLHEICRRIEIELCLQTLKYQRQHAQPTPC